MHPGRLRAAAAGREAAVHGALQAELRGAQPQRPGLRQLGRTRCLRPTAPADPAIGALQRDKTLLVFKS